MSLRQSRTIYATLAVVFLPIMVIGLGYGVSAIGAISESLSIGTFSVGLGGAVIALMVAAVFVGVEYAVIAQIFEVNRRLKILRDHPDQTVRKLPAPFQSSLFGPYH